MADDPDSVKLILIPGVFFMDCDYSLAKNTHFAEISD
jgi:hypothetical protein